MRVIRTKGPEKRVSAVFSYCSIQALLHYLRVVRTTRICHIAASYIRTGDHIKCLRKQKLDDAHSWKADVYDIPVDFRDPRLPRSQLLRVLQLDFRKVPGRSSCLQLVVGNAVAVEIIRIVNDSFLYGEI
jgi:hypothetical protein